MVLLLYDFSGLPIMVSGEILSPQFHFHVGALCVSFLEGLIFDLYYITVQVGSYLSYSLLLYY